MSDKKQSVRAKWSKIIGLGVICLLVTITSELLVTLASYPTPAHRDKAAAIVEIQKSPEYELGVANDREVALQNSDESRYSSSMSVLATLISFGVFIALMWSVYGYSKRTRLVNNHRRMTICLLFLASAAGMFLSGPLQSWVFGVSLGSIDWLMQLAFIPSLFILTVLAMIVVEKLYARRHSLVI